MWPVTPTAEGLGMTSPSMCVWVVSITSACVPYFSGICHRAVLAAEKAKLSQCKLAGLPGAGKAQDKSVHGGHFPYVSYLKGINQANKPLNEICSILLPC